VTYQPTRHDLDERAAAIAADLNATGHHQAAEQVRAATTGMDYDDAAAHIDAIAGAVSDLDLYDRLRAHVPRLHTLMFAADGLSREHQP
jgi:hypothetical protein